MGHQPGEDGAISDHKDSGKEPYSGVESPILENLGNFLTRFRGPARNDFRSLWGAAVRPSKVRKGEKVWARGQRSYTRGVVMYRIQDCHKRSGKRCVEGGAVRQDEREGGVDSPSAERHWGAGGAPKRRCGEQGQRKSAGCPSTVATPAKTFRQPSPRACPPSRRAPSSPPNASAGLSVQTS